MTTNYEMRIDNSINKFYDNISDNLSEISRIPQDKALLILNELLSFFCDASNQNLIDYSSNLLEKIPREWLKENVRAAIKLDSDETWNFDLTDPYTVNRLISFLNQIGCYSYITELTAPK